jgi:hypothetical protein
MRCGSCEQNFGSDRCCLRRVAFAAWLEGIQLLAGRSCHGGLTGRWAGGDAASGEAGFEVQDLARIDPNSGKQMRVELLIRDPLVIVALDVEYNPVGRTERCCWFSAIRFRSAGVYSCAEVFQMASGDALYSERYCAFIDILGFSGLISDLDREKVSLDEIRVVLSVVHAPPKTVRPQDADLRSQSISDAVALSAAPNAAGFDAICTAAETLSLRLLRSGYFARGGIAKGRLYHDHSMIFGPGLIEAYRLEHDVAKFPRILIPRAVAADSLEYAKQGTHWKHAFEGRFIQAKDGPFFLHILRNHSMNVEKMKRDSKAPGDSTVPILKIMRAAIQKRFDEASDNPDHFQKVAWFVDYWNSHFDLGTEGLERIVTQPL